MANLYLLNLACSFYLMGLIWTIQVVHYPAFSFVEKSQFSQFSQLHQSGMTYIVAPIMILELATVLLLWKQNWTDPKIVILALIVGLIWISTFYVSVPLHTDLAGGFNLNLIDRLVKTNWPRTILWSAKTVLMVYFLRSYVSIR